MEKSTYKVLHSDTQNKESGHTLFDRCKQQFVWAVKWNVLESLLYHLIFITHQTCLYKVFGQELYGKAGTLIAFSFLLVTFFLGALDTTLIGYIQFFTQSKRHFKILINNYIIRHCLFVLTAPLILCLLKYLGFVQITGSLSWGTCLLIGALVVLETIRKLLRHTLQLMFYNKHTASLEVAGIVMYALAFWGSYWYGVPFGPALVLTPFLLPSVCSIIYFCFLFSQESASLKESTDQQNHSAGFRKAQFYAFINQVARSLFSSNFLVPLFALSAGYMEAGIAALANYVTYTFSFFIHKICTPAAAALFSHTNTLTKDEQQQAFGLAVKLFFSLATLALSVLVFYGWITLSDLSFKTISYASFFFIVHVMEHLYTLYEKFFMAQNQAKLLALLNVTTCLFAGYAFWMLHKSFFIEAIIISFCIRIGLLIFLSYIIFPPKKLPIFSIFYKKPLKTSI